MVEQGLLGKIELYCWYKSRVDQSQFLLSCQVAMEPIRQRRDLWLAPVIAAVVLPVFLALDWVADLIFRPKSSRSAIEMAGFCVFLLTILGLRHWKRMTSNDKFAIISAVIISFVPWCLIASLANRLTTQNILWIWPILAVNLYFVFPSWRRATELDREELMPNDP